jgi:hypothetical protein
VPPNNPFPTFQQGYENSHSIRDEVPRKCFVTHNFISIAVKKSLVLTCGGSFPFSTII